VRRLFFGLAVAAISANTCLTSAQTRPTRAIEPIVPFTARSPLSSELSRSIIIENRTGAGGTISAATAKPNGALYQLQENCRKLAAETFGRQPPDEDREDYREHHNVRLNKCFYEETYRSLTPVGSNLWVYLFDLPENRIYGGFHRSTNIGIFYCNLGDKECHSEAEWEALVKTYMEG
jgi:hypothetical protein